MSKDSKRFASSQLCSKNSTFSSVPLNEALVLWRELRGTRDLGRVSLQ